MNANLTRQDIDILFEAVEAWEKEEKGPGIMGHILGGIIGDKSSAAGAKYESELKNAQEKADKEKRQRKERGVILRAKLIMMRDHDDASRFVDSVTDCGGAVRQ